MCDLNPIELAWTKTKRIVRENNVTRSEPAVMTTSDERCSGICDKGRKEGFADTQKQSKANIGKEMASFQV
jgi:transposase